MANSSILRKSNFFSDKIRECHPYGDLSPLIAYVGMGKGDAEERARLLGPRGLL